MMGRRRLWALPAAALLLAGCSDEGPVAPRPLPDEGSTEYLVCQVEVASGEVSCAAQPGLEGGALGTIIGGQGVYVQLASSNVGYDSGNEIFSADVTVKNLTTQVLGSLDGSSASPSGIRVFFVDPPATTGGTGVVTVANADGTASFGKTDQPYFQYSQALPTGVTSLARNWQWSVPSTVASFSFMVGVSADVPDQGTLEPGLHFAASTLSADSLHTCAIDLTGQAWCWGEGANGRLGNGEEVAYSTPQRVDQGSLTFTSIDAGLHFTCALDISGAAYCWGNGGQGRMGDGTSTTVNTRPVPVSGGLEFQQISTGRAFTCGLTTAGEVWCWGYNGNGQLGDGTMTLSNVPVAVQGGHTFTSIATGGFHSCGVTTGGVAYCWGSRTNGKLGDARTDSSSVELAQVLGGHRFVSIYAGQQHTCALKAGGEAWCWGSGANGKLGDGTNVAKGEPVEVQTSLRFASLSLGNNHTCGITFDGSGWCWGSGARGKLGSGATTSVSEPVPVVDGHRFAQIDAGSDHTCGITTGGEVYCWGTGNEGRLGTASTTNISSPGVLTWGSTELLQTTPVIAADSLHTCTIDADGQAWCWGAGGSGRLGNGTEVERRLPTPVSQGSSRYVDIDYGLNFACALDTDGAAWCWGAGGNGRLGNGSDENSGVPVAVLDGHIFKQIITGRQFACGLDNAGEAWCWGYNNNGQLGNGTEDHMDRPTKVIGGHTFTTIAAGTFHVCGITPGGETYCWGSQANGKLGNGVATSGKISEPTLVVGGHTFVSVTASAHHTCALKADGEAWCWGNQEDGKLGNGEDSGTTGEPQQVATSERFSTLAVDRNHSCGVTLGGAAFCWGSNESGMLGTGTVGGAVSVPEQVAASNSFVSIAAGTWHTCGVTTSDTVLCWGADANGQLGIAEILGETGTPVEVQTEASVKANF